MPSSSSSLLATRSPKQGWAARIVRCSAAHPCFASLAATLSTRRWLLVWHVVQPWMQLAVNVEVVCKALPAMVTVRQPGGGGHALRSSVATQRSRWRRHAGPRCAPCAMGMNWTTASKGRVTVKSGRHGATRRRSRHGGQQAGKPKHCTRGLTSREVQSLPSHAHCPSGGQLVQYIEKRRKKTRAIWSSNCDKYIKGVCNGLF